MMWSKMYGILCLNWFKYVAIHENAAKDPKTLKKMGWTRKYSYASPTKSPGYTSLTSGVGLLYVTPSPRLLTPEQGRERNDDTEPSSDDGDDPQPCMAHLFETHPHNNWPIINLLIVLGLIARTQTKQRHSGSAKRSENLWQHGNHKCPNFDSFCPLKKIPTRLQKFYLKLHSNTQLDVYYFFFKEVQYLNGQF